MNGNLRNQSRPRKGALLIELLVCTILLGVVLTSIIPTLGTIARQRQLARERQAALLEVGNLMERLTILDWEEITPERAKAVALSETLQRELSNPRLTTDVLAEADAKRVLVELRWDVAPGRPAPPVRLAAWVHRRGEGPRRGKPE